jgi:hypothetical protein
MNNEKKTHWKKNNDSRYICGEDLKHGISIGKGLKDNMIVCITSFEDSETFDQKEQVKIIKTGLFLTDMETNELLYKPVILNNKNGEFCVKEFRSEFIEDWLNKPFVLYAQPDRRHGFVARFKKYFPKAVASDQNALSTLRMCDNLESLSVTWSDLLTSDEKKLPTVIALKDKLKTELSNDK